MLGEIEPLRKDKRIGSSLQARVVLSAGPAEMELLRPRVAELPMLFIVSEVEVREGTGELQIAIEKATRAKCERCWRYVADVSPVSGDAGHEPLCDRCRNALTEAVRS